jgi:hypothetical protein
MPSRKLLALVVVLVVAIAALSAYWVMAPDGKEGGGPTVPHDHFNAMPDYWTRISTGLYGDEVTDSYQCALRDDYYGTGEPVTITCYHHGHVGVFKETESGGAWAREPVCACFDPANATGIPVKGIFTANLDSDPSPEILTAADEVHFFPLLGNPKSWAGPAYVDLNEGGAPVVQVLVWGGWGERATSNGPVMRPMALEPGFRSPTNALVDILINTMPASGSRLLVLEQPPQGFGAVNYTFDASGLVGVAPYEEEPFYVNHLYELRGGMFTELVWTPSDVPGSEGVYMEGLPFDADGDQQMDLVVGGTYFHGDDFVASRLSVYRRVPHLEHGYVFEQVFCQTFDRSHIWGIGERLDCDGDPSNGRESVAFQYTNRDVPTQRARPTGFMVLKPSGASFRIDPIEVPVGAGYPYVRVYSHMVVHDWNGDGFDDVVVLTDDVNTWELTYGDLNLWLNTGDFRGRSFRYDAGHCLALFDNQCISWGVSPVQLDDDPAPEVSVCTMAPDHYWDATDKGAKFAWAMDVEDFLAHRG